LSSLSRLVGWILAGFYALVPNYAFAILCVGITFMVLIVPLTLKSTRSMLAMQKLQPKMKQLQAQHKDDKLALQQAVSELYKQEGVNPLGGCLPAIAPFPLLYVLYHVIDGLSHTQLVSKGVYKADPLYLSTGTRMYHDLLASAPKSASTALGAAAKIHSLGINLATSASTAISHHLGFTEIFGSLFLLLVMIGANYYQQVQISNLNPMVKQNQQMSQQMRMMRFFPVIFGLICIRLPSGLVLYYGVSALFRVGQQWMMYHYDPKVKALVAKDNRDIDALDARLNELERKQGNPSTGAKSGSTGNGKLTPPRANLTPPRTKLNPNGASSGTNGKSAVPPARSTNAAAGSKNRNRRRKGR
jgi:YidC/Oxa1 family membrane protein insertase